MVRALAEFLVLLALIIVVAAAFALAFGAVRFKNLQSRFRKAAEARAVARDNPFTTYDINFMVESGMTPDQIEKAVRNAVREGKK